MSKLWPKVIRDSVHGIIPFEDTPSDRLLLDLINTREFQRLRRIKQLGMSELVFPGSTHTRLAHSLGVMHIARMILDWIARSTGKPLRSDQRTAVLVAALLHDVGHGPFSHAFEKVTGQSHEARTLEIITDPSTEVCKVLSNFDKELPDRLVVFFDEEIDEGGRDRAEIPPFLTQVVSSQLDADRFDYLLRDSLATGTDYGRFDLQWLILQLRLDEAHCRFYLSPKAISAAEAYVYARYHMYRSVYFHKTTRAAEVMVRLLFSRYRQLLQEATTDDQKNSIVPDTRLAIIEAFAGKLSLSQYLALDDVSVAEFFRACEGSLDNILKSLGNGLVSRRLYKAADVSGVDGDKVATFFSRARDCVQQDGLDLEYTLVSDRAADTPYKPYNPDESTPASQIYIEVPGKGPVELSNHSNPVNQLRTPYTLLRYYYPASIRDRIDMIVAETLRKE